MKRAQQGRLNCLEFKNQRLKFLSHEEAKAQLNILKNKDQQIHDMVLLSLHIGLRAGEIFSLTWGVVNIENGFVLIRNKTAKESLATYISLMR